MQFESLAVPSSFSSMTLGSSGLQDLLSGQGPRLPLTRGIELGLSVGSQPLRAQLHAV